MRRGLDLPGETYRLAHKGGIALRDEARTAAALAEIVRASLAAAGWTAGEVEAGTPDWLNEQRRTFQRGPERLSAVWRTGDRDTPDVVCRYWLDLRQLDLPWSSTGKPSADLVVLDLPAGTAAEGAFALLEGALDGFTSGGSSSAAAVWPDERARHHLVLSREDLRIEAELRVLSDNGGLLRLEATWAD